ncbi:MAG: alcohol dehydrogenase catalytic domain-containing protein [Thermoactinomyces sp.]
MYELYLSNPNEIELRNVESPSPKEDEVKLKMIYGGICGSDLGVYQGKLQHATYPLRPGHELLGTIIEAGPDAKYEVGTRVVVLPNTFCGQCEMCVKDHTNLCVNKKSMGVNIDGGFSEEFIVSSKFVLPLPPDLPDEKAVLIEPLSVVVHALNKVDITKGTSVAVVGCGNEGMLAVALSTFLGAQVTAIDIQLQKLERARKVWNVQTIHLQELKNETFDVVIEAAGTKSSVERAIQLVKKGGALVIIGLAQEANFPITHIVRNELSIYGSIIYNFPSDYFKSIEFLQDPSFNVKYVVSQIVPFREYQQAYQTALSGSCGKIILNFKEAT